MPPAPPTSEDDQGSRAHKTSAEARAAADDAPVLHLESDDTVTIIVVDDEAPIRAALNRVLTKVGHTVLAAESGEEALSLLRSQMHAQVMLLDVRMPGMSGIEVVTEALEVEPDLSIIMLSGINDATTASICMQRGATDYLTKPIELKELNSAISRAMRRRHMRIQDRNISDWLREEVAERTKELLAERTKLEQITVATLEALVNALEAKDPYLAGHSARVAAMSATIAAEMGLNDDEVEQVRTAGRLHDLGKIGTRESVLNKKGPLTPEEYEHVKQHVVIGSQILAPLSHLGPIIGFVRHHHERWDGTGYPDGWGGDAIPLGARIIGATEIYDALTTARSYQDKLTPAEATERMRILSGTTIGPQVMDALNAVVARRQALVFIGDD
jgi:putative nucleotidyltransferase with HDIG domain